MPAKRLAGRPPAGRMPDMSLLPGEVFAGFVIERELGAGGMGVVYLARHPRLPRRVALKLLRTELGADPSFVVRFRREAETVARLDHPNIVAIDDSGAENGALWISMKFIDGRTAGAALADYERGMPPSRAVHIIEKVASALDFAHRHNVIHRDVKPANVLLTESDDGDDERVYLTDFGVAKAMGEIEAQATSLTATGGVVATLDYAAPEQIESRQLDGRCDVYALGCVLFKLLTGAIPYPGATLGAKVYARMHRPPPAPTALVPTLPSAFDEVVARALALEPADRYQTCKALAVAARAALLTPPRGSTSTERMTPGGNGAAGSGSEHGPKSPAATTGPSEEGSPRSHRLPSALSPPPNPTSRRQEPAPRTSNPPHTSQQSLPHDVAQRRGPGLPPNSGATPVPTITPPNRRRQRSRMAIGAVLLVAAIVAGIAFVQRGGIAGTGLRSRDADSSPAGEASTTTAKPSSTTPTTRTPPQSSTNTSPIASSATRTSTSTTAPSTSTTRLQLFAGLPHSAALPTTTILVSRDSPDIDNPAQRFGLYPVDSNTGEVGKPIKLTDQPMNSILAPDRTSIIYTANDAAGKGMLRTVAPDGRGDRVLFPRPNDCDSLGRPAWNPVKPDQLAITCGTSKSPPADLRIVDLEGNEIRKLTTDLQVIDDLSFSPNGMLVAYWGSKTAGAGGGQLYIQNVSGSAPVAITAPEFNDADPDFSLDGRQIAFRRVVGSGGKNYSDIAVVDTTGGTVRFLTRGDSNKQGPVWSPDGNQIAYKNDLVPDAEGTKNEVWVLTVRSGTDGRAIAGDDPHPLATQDPGSIQGSPTWGLR